MLLVELAYAFPPNRPERLVSLSCKENIGSGGGRKQNAGQRSLPNFGGRSGLVDNSSGKDGL